MADAIDAVGLIRIHPSDGGPVAALRGLDLRVPAGEVTAVVGPSGSGKSTLLRLIAGLERPSAGRLTVLGRDLMMATDRELSRHRRERVALVEQHYRRALSPYLSVADAVALPLWLRGVGVRDREARVRELLERVGLSDRGGSYRRELSGGEQQRVAFSVALAMRPPLVLADEPTAELDAATATGVLEMIRELVRAEGATCVIVTHDDLVERFADRVVHIADGRLVAEGAPRRGRGPERATDAQGWLAPPLPTVGAPGPPGPRASLEGAAVALDGAARRYGHGQRGDLGLPPVTVAFARGGFHVITGPSGTGKTTLLRLVTGLDRPTNGRVTTLGKDLATLDREGLARFRARHVGIVDQVRDLVPFLTALENVELGLAIRGRDGPDASARAREALQAFGLARHADRRPTNFSAGEQLRVALARAMAAQPELLVLDEPTAALDRRAAAAVAGMLRDIDPRVTVLATTHDAALIAAASDRFDLRDAVQATREAAAAASVRS